MSGLSPLSQARCRQRLFASRLICQALRGYAAHERTAIHCGKHIRLVDTVKRRLTFLQLLAFPRSLNAVPRYCRYTLFAVLTFKPVLSFRIGPDQ